MWLVCLTEPIAFIDINNNFIDYAKENIGKYFIGDKGNLPAPFVESYSFLWRNKAPEESIPKDKKTDFCSIIFSGKNFAPGHDYRIRLVDEILKTELPIDIWGLGCNLDRYKKLTDPRIKGKFERFEPYMKYKFHVCIENFQSNHYFSEKIINSLLVNTVPIYLGWEILNNIFPKK